jgi:hypothetical protein
MAEFTYTQSPANIKKLFEQIRSVGVPTKVAQKWLESIGLKTKPDRALVGVLKFINFIDSSGSPTQTWSDYRIKNKSAIVLAQSMRAAYSGLFSMYPDAHRKDDEALHNFFTSNSSLSAVMVKSVVNTFKSLKELADFESDVPESIEEDVAEVVAEKEIEKEKEKDTKKPVNSGVNGLAVTVNIQLQIPATDDASVYDKFFESLYKHVLSKDKE